MRLPLSARIIFFLHPYSLLLGFSSNKFGRKVEGVIPKAQKKIVLGFKASVQLISLVSFLIPFLLPTIFLSMSHSHLCSFFFSLLFRLICWYKCLLSLSLSPHPLSLDECSIANVDPNVDLSPPTLLGNDFCY